MGESDVWTVTKQRLYAALLRVGWRYLSHLLAAMGGKRSMKRKPLASAVAHSLPLDTTALLHCQALCRSLDEGWRGPQEFATACHLLPWLK